MDPHLDPEKVGMDPEPPSLDLTKGMKRVVVATPGTPEQVMPEVQEMSPWVPANGPESPAEKAREKARCHLYHDPLDRRSRPRRLAF